MFLKDLREPITKLDGVGKKASASYASLKIFTLADLLLLAPRAWEDRKNIVPVGFQGEKGYCNTSIRILRTSFFGAKRILKVIAKDTSVEDGKSVSLLCFGRNFLERILLPGKDFYFYGLVIQSHGEYQCSSFEVAPKFLDDRYPSSFGKILPIYPLAGSLTQKIVRKNVKAILDRVTKIDDELPESIMQRNGLISYDRAIRLYHFPSSMEDVSKARRTLAFSELFLLQLSSRRKTIHPSFVNILEGDSDLEKKFIEQLDFSLTPDQKTVLFEIKKDLSSGKSMNRLLQGDVGSGKTLIAWISALHVITSGYQVAFMAPTELLARQHAENAVKLLSKLGIRLAFLTGSVKQKERKLLLAELKKGNIDILIGTHALFSKEVKFKNLGYIIIDEQHRFGVEQRSALFMKGNRPNVLLMTATPIPRTLALTVFGNLNVSTIKTMPAGRLPIITHIVGEKSRQKMFSAINVEFERGHQAYFVYPRIEEEGNSNLKDVISMGKYLSEEVYPGVPSAVIHSRLSEEEKMTILRDFTAGNLKYLVSTSVVEVGIDVPNATCMVIEHSERFGLSALHQLRGRVGRSNLQSWCFLVFAENITDDGKERLRVMKESNDGFFIAEKDLVIRGPGELSGVKQSGYLKLHFADLTQDIDIVRMVRKEVNSLLTSDPGLLSAENSILRVLT